MFAIGGVGGGCESDDWALEPDLPWGQQQQFPGLQYAKTL
jgi:hypothetical protein